VLSELDPDRRVALLAALDGQEQVVLTSADPAASLAGTSRKVTIFQVRDGVCTP
jgi:recombinational DNA repair ATPase RecF